VFALRVGCGMVSLWVIMFLTMILVGLVSLLIWR
jgi:hypothetical protein